MKNKIEICQNCKQNFTIEPEDFLFYLPEVATSLQAGEKII